MSFSGKIKEELAEHVAKARHCNLAELTAILHMCGEFEEDKNGICTIRFRSENYLVARKCFTLMSKTFNIEADIVVRKNMTNGSTSYFMRWAGEELLAVKNALVQAVCCKRAYIRGAFIAAGSMSDPSKSYHFEIVCGELAQAEYVRDMINSFDLDAKIVTRKKTFVVYLKEGSQIVDVLNIMEAHIALMELENVRILIRPTIRFLHCFLTIVLQNIIRSAVSAFHGLARTICLIPILKISPAKLLWLFSAFL